MIHPHEITIGSLLRTNKGEIIRVESISSKSQNRKVGYHRADEPTKMRYVRLSQCEGIELTTEILEKNGWTFNGFEGWKEAGYDLEYTHSKSNLDLVFESDGSKHCTILGVFMAKMQYSDFRFPDCVHDLQLLLIAEGFPELAMKLKIE